MTVRAIAATAASVAALAPAAARAATITVTTTSDVVANDGQCSLREALNAAAIDAGSGSVAGECPAGSGADTIVLGPNRYTLSRPGVDDNNVGGDLDVVGGTVTIAGAGAATTIDGGGIDRVLDVLFGANLTVQNLTITGGRPPTGSSGTNAGPGIPGGDSKGGAGAPGGGGGGIRNAGTLVLNGVTVTANHAGDGGAGGTGANGGAGVAGTGGKGGESDGGAGGDGGSGGGVLNAGGTATVTGSVFTGNFAGNGGIGGAGANGGAGGSGGANQNGGTGGPCRGGNGGAGGSGGGIATVLGTLTISSSDIEHNTTGGGGVGNGCGAGGTGGAAGSGASGGAGGFAFGGFGGGAGHGGGVSDLSGALTLTNSTVASNTTASGGAGQGTPTGGQGGAGGGTGGFEFSGSGGAGGFGGGVGVLSSNAGEATAAIAGDTIAGNLAGNGANGAPGATGGNGNSSHGGSGGEAGQGGGIDLDASFTVTNTTVTGNRAGTGGAGGAGGAGPGQSTGGSGGLGGFGGGIAVRGGGSVAHLTAVGNTPGLGGTAGGAGTGHPATAGTVGEDGSGGDVSAFLGQVSEAASILGSCSGTITDGGGNIAIPGASLCPGTAVVPGFGPLADNGGPTQTMALSAGSPAVDLIKRPCGTTPDQRGVARPQGAGCDAGAYEWAPPAVLTGPASQISAKSATVAAQVNPNARATSWHIDFGRTPAYGSRTPDRPLAAGLSSVAVSAALSGLPAHTPIHYRVVATNADGTAVGTDATFTTANVFGGLQIIARSLTASRRGDVPVTVFCPSAASGACRGSLAITATVRTVGARAKRRTTKTRTITLAKTAVRIAAGRRVTVHLHLSASSRSLVRAAGRRGLAVTLRASTRDGGGGAAVGTSVKTTLKLARK